MKSNKRIIMRQLMKFSIVSLLLIMVSIVFSQQSFIVLAAEQSNDNSTTFIDGEFTYTILSEKDHTVCITSIQPGDATSNLLVPEKVNHMGNSYMVTDIKFDNKTSQYEKVRKLTIPASVTGDILITSTKRTDGLPDEKNPDMWSFLAPFPKLESVTFLGQIAPKSIEILSYLSYQDMIYQVPSGTEEAYKAASRDSFLQTIRSYADWDGDDAYKSYKVAPLIVSDRQPNPEPHLFQTDHGVYLVTSSTTDQKGTAALIKAKKLVREYNYITPDSGNFQYPAWDNYTIETDAVYGSYHYIVTALWTGALLDFQKVTMLTIPDTITEMQTHSIYAGNHLSFLFFSKNCKTIPADIFNSGENGSLSGAVFYVPYGVTKIDKSLSAFHINQLYLPKDINAPIDIKKICDKIIYYDKPSSSIGNEELKVSSNRIWLSIGNKGKIDVCNANQYQKDIIHYSCMDPSIAVVSDNGIITPKHAGIAYILVFSEKTGSHQLIQVEVKDRTFTKGIFTYRINYSTKPEVTVIACKPTKSSKVIRIPASVTYKGKKYIVTQVCAGDYIIDEYNWYNYTTESGYPRVYDHKAPLISDKDAKGSSVTEIIFPSTIKRNVTNIGNLPKLTKIVFEGSKAPSLIALSQQNYKTAVIYVPVKTLNTYKKTKWIWEIESSQYYSEYSKDSGIRLKTYQ